MPETAEVAARRADLKPRRDNLGLQQTETLAALAAEPQDGVVAPGKLNLSELQKVLRNDEAYLKMLVIGDTVYAKLIGPHDAALWRADIGAAGLDPEVAAILSTISTVENGRLVPSTFAAAHDRLDYTHLLRTIGRPTPRQKRAPVV